MAISSTAALITAACAAFLVGMVAVSADAPTPIAATSAAATGAAPAPTTSATKAAAEPSPANVIVLTKDADFDGLAAKGLVVVDFFAVWCEPCKVLIPELDAVARANPGKITVIRVDVEAHPDLAARFEVDPIPDMMVIRDGKKVDNYVGVKTAADITTWLKL
jgi:thioredoxin